MSATLPALSRACNVTRSTATDAPEGFIIRTTCAPSRVVPTGLIAEREFEGTRPAARRFAGLALIADHVRLGYGAAVVTVTTAEDGVIVHSRRLAARAL